MDRSIIVGDPHIGKGLSMGKCAFSGAVNSRILDQFNILNWILEQAVEKHVTRIIFTGDIFEDPKPDPSFLNMFIEWLNICGASNIDVHLVTGNHDIKRFGSFYYSSLDLINSMGLPHIFVYKDVTSLTTNGVVFTFVPFRDKRSFNCDTPEEALFKLKTKLAYETIGTDHNLIKVCIGHLALEGSLPVGDEIDDLINELMCPLDMFYNYDYVWMGHIHKPQVMCNDVNYVAHIGSMDLSDFGESEQVKHIVLFDPYEENKFQHIKIPSRPLRRLKIVVKKGEDPTDVVIQSINDLHKKRNLKNSLLKIEVKIEDAESELTNRQVVNDRLNDLGVFFMTSFSESKSVISISDANKKAIASDISPQAAVKLWGDVVSNNDDDDKSLFVKKCLEIIEAVESKK